MALLGPVLGPRQRRPFSKAGEGGGVDWRIRDETGALPVIDYDFVGRRYWRDGAYRTEASEFVVVAGAPAYDARGLFCGSTDRLTGPVPSFFPTGEMAILVESRVVGAPATVDVFSLAIINQNVRLECERRINNTAGMTANQGATTFAFNGFGSADLSQNIGRAVFKLANGVAPRVAVNGVISSAGTAYTGYTAPFNRMGVGFNARFDNGNLNGHVRRITAWARAPSDAFMVAQSLRTTKTNIHVLGDSFVTSAYVSTLRDQYLDAEYRTFSMDGVGGSSITAQADRFDLTPDKYDRTLVIMDGGLDTDGAATIAAINRMVAHLTHNRWVYVMPSPNANIAGSAGRITFDAAVAQVRAYVGESRFIDTLTPALAHGDGSTQDNTDIANQVWPTSLRNAGDSIHPTTAGWGICIATPLAAKLNANGWA